LELVVGHFQILIIKKDTQRNQKKRLSIYKPSLRIDNSKFCENSLTLKSPNQLFFKFQKLTGFLEWGFFFLKIGWFSKPAGSKLVTRNQKDYFAK